MEEVGPRAQGAAGVDEIAHIDVTHSDNAVERSIDLLKGLQRLQLFHVSLHGFNGRLICIVGSHSVVYILLSYCVGLQQAQIASFSDLCELEIGFGGGQIATRLLQLLVNFWCVDLSE